MDSFIIIRTQFEGVHWWEDAPEEVNFLRYPHRHLFKIAAKIYVTHSNRELEFFMVKHKIDLFCKKIKLESCESIAAQIAEYLIKNYGSRQMSIEVSEDGENCGGVEI